MDTNANHEQNDDETFLAANRGFVTEDHQEEDEELVTGNVVAPTETDRTSILQFDLESLKDLQTSLITTTMAAMLNKKRKKIEPHLEAAFLTSLGYYPAGRKGIDVIRWVTKLDTLVNTYLRDLEPKEMIKILFRTVTCPEMINQLSLAFKLSDAAITFTKPPIWKEEWPFPINADTSEINVWFARVILSHGCSRETMADFVRSLTPSRQQDKEKYSNLVLRLQALKSMSIRCANLFPDKFEIYKPSSYDHYLVSELEPRLARKVAEVLENEKRQRNNMLDVLKIRHLDIPEPAPKTHLEMTQLVRSVANKINSDSDGSDSEEDTDKGARFTHMLPANVNFVMYEGNKKEKKKTPKENVANKGLLDIMEKQQKLIDNLLAQKQQEIRPHYNSYYNANTEPIGKTQRVPQTRAVADVECYRCHNLGHFATDCKMSGGPIRQTNRHQSQRDNPYRRTNLYCANCNERSHMVYDCPQPARRPCKLCKGDHLDVRCNLYIRPGLVQQEPMTRQEPKQNKNVSFRVVLPQEKEQENARITVLE